MEWTAAVATPTKRNRILLILAALALGFWLGRPAPRTEPALAPTTTIVTAHSSDKAVAAPGLPELQRSASTSKILRMEDRLTTAALDVKLRVLVGEEEVEVLRAGDFVDLSRLPAGSTLSYTLGSIPLEHTVALTDCLRDSADAWLLSLPYSCRLEFQFGAANQTHADQSGQLLLCQDPRTVPEPEPLDDRAGPYTRDTSDMSLAGLLHWKLRNGQLKSLQKLAISSQAPAPLSVSAAGPFVVSVQFPDGSCGVSPVQLIPGAIIPVAVELRARPRMRGRLLDWEGNPVPGEKVILTVALDLTNYDMRPGDPHGMMAYREEGVLTQSVKKTYRTDADGAFDLSVPHGREYALYSYALGGYAFWSTLDGAAPAAEMLFDLRLAEPSAANLVEIRVLQPDGQPLREGSIDIGVAGDLPFFRQWPAGLALDEEGCVTVSGMEPGMRIGLMIHHDALARGIYAPAYPTVPASRKIEVRLPSESYLAFQ
jgi:hypothetical protein